MYTFDEARKHVKSYRTVNTKVTEEETLEAVEKTYKAVANKLDVLDGLEQLMNFLSTHKDAPEANTGAGLDEKALRLASEILGRTTAKEMKNLSREEKANAVQRLLEYSMVKLVDNGQVCTQMMPKLYGAQKLIRHAMAEGKSALKKEAKCVEQEKEKLEAEEARLRADLSEFNLISDEEVLKLHPKLIEEIEAAPEDAADILTLAKLNHELELRRNATHVYKEMRDKVKTDEKKLLKERILILDMESRSHRMADIASNVLEKAATNLAGDAKGVKASVKRVQDAWKGVEPPEETVSEAKSGQVASNGASIQAAKSELLEVAEGVKNAKISVLEEGEIIDEGEIEFE